jgi:acetylornithine/succinyldiaminopimelate/putrescine aminotransferase
MLEIDHASGIYLVDTSGKRYVDLNSGYCVSALGHCHPEVVAAIQDQSASYLHTSVYGEHIQSPQVLLAQKLIAQLDPSLDCVFFVNSGAEAVEGAMKLAKRVTGRPEIIACHKAYHGSTQGADSLRSDLEYTNAFMPLLPGIRHISFSDHDGLEAISTNTAAVIIEPVQG